MMSEAYIKMLQEKRANAFEAAKALLDKATEEKRDLDATEQVEYDRINADIDTLGERANGLLKHLEEQRDIDESFRKLTADNPLIPSVQNGPNPTDELRKVLESAPGSYAYEAARPSADEMRVLTEGTTTAGGFTVPQSFYNRLWEVLIVNAALLGAGVTIIPTTQGNPLVLPSATSFSTGALVAEGGTIGASDPAFIQRTLSSYKYAVLNQISSELTRDSAFDLQAFIARQAGRALGNKFGADLMVGTGGGAAPTGLTTSTTLGVTGGTGVVGVPTFDNLIDLFYSVTAPYRASDATKWLIKDSTAGALRKLKDTTGRYLWEPALVPGTPDTILGKPVATDPNVAATGLNNKSVIFGDLSAYAARVVGGARFERSVDYAFNTDLITYRTIIQGDGILMDQTGAVKHYVGAAS